MSTLPDPWTILVADDDVEHCRLTREAWKEVGFGQEMRFVKDGAELLAYLYRQEGFVDAFTAPRPGLILLDLNMPRKSGLEALAEIKADPGLSRIPVVILTTSKNPQDMFHTSVLGVNGFMIKPSTFTGYLEMMTNLMSCWADMVERPVILGGPGPGEWLGKPAVC